jgi:hypothetical protein
MRYSNLVKKFKNMNLTASSSLQATSARINMEPKPSALVAAESVQPSVKDLPPKNHDYNDRQYFVDKNISPTSHVILGKYYEDLVINKLNSDDFLFRLHGNSKMGKDKGIDFRGLWTVKNYEVVGQCKHYKKNSISVKVVREFQATVHNTSRELRKVVIGVLVGSTGLSKEALAELNLNSCPLVFVRLIPNSGMSLGIDSADLYGWVQSLLLNDALKAVVDGEVQVETKYDEYLSKRLSRPIRHEVIRLK